MMQRIFYSVFAMEMVRYQPKGPGLLLETHFLWGIAKFFHEVFLLLVGEFSWSTCAFIIEWSFDQWPNFKPGKPVANGLLTDVVTFGEAAGRIALYVR